jgi:hypothetical protein
MQGKLLFSPKDLNRKYCDLLNSRGWAESRVNYWVTADEKLIRQTINKSAEEQKAERGGWAKAHF